VNRFLPLIERLNGRVVPASRISWGTVKVPGVTVDGLALEYGFPDVVVIDVEGFEARVLTGAMDTLHACRSDFLVEFHTGAGLEDVGASVQEVLSFFPGSMYQLYVAPDGRAFQAYGPGLDVMLTCFFLLATASQ
jgi:Methyltransferase FkbM domain